MMLRRSVLVLFLLASCVSAETIPTEEFYLNLMMYPGFIFFILAWYGGQIRDGDKVTYYGFDPMGRVIFLMLSSVLLGTSAISMLNIRLAGAGSVAYVFADIQATGVESMFAWGLGGFAIVIGYISWLKASELAITPVVNFVSKDLKDDLSRKKELNERRGF